MPYSTRTHLPALTLSLITFILGMSYCLAEPKQAQPITAEELHAHPERFLVYEVTSDHYIVYRLGRNEEIKLEDQILWGRVEGLHIQSYRGSSSERSPQWGPVRFSLSTRNAHTGYNDSLEFRHPAPEPLHSADPARSAGAPAPPVQYQPRPPPTMEIHCYNLQNEAKRTQLRLLPPEEASVKLAQARVIPPPHKPYRTHALLRDDWGVYYLIEQNVDPYKQSDFRLWVGYRGAMERVPVITAAHDSMGVVLVSKDAAIRLVTQGAERGSGCQEPGAYWVSKDPTQATRKELIKVPYYENTQVIFSQLGIYDQLYFGQPCDILQGRLMPRLDHPEELPPADLIRYELPSP